jgi:hypothetical protein
MLVSMNHLIIVKTLPVTTPGGLFRLSKAACDPENCSESLPQMYTVENYPMKEKERRKRNEKFSKKQAKTL